MRFKSLTGRLVAWSALALAVSLFASAVALDEVYRRDAMDLIHERLDAQIYAVLAGAQLDAEGAIITFAAPPDPRFATPDSGLYARVLDRTGAVLWRSTSWLEGKALTFPVPTELGVSLRTTVLAASGDELFGAGLAVEWEDLNGNVEVYVVQVAEQREAFDTRVAAFRADLIHWLVVAVVALIFVQAAVLAGGLAPLRRAAADVEAIRDGERQRLKGSYPTELQPLVSSLNTLMEASERRMERYQHGLADLAHSLKTPLAVMRSALRASEQELRETVDVQVDRMDSAVAYQLQRASAAGASAIGPPLAIKPMAESIVNSLYKVYAERKLNIRCTVDQGLTFRADEGDVMEIVGNLSDNACKWANTDVQLRVQCDRDGALVVEVEDDGPGIPAELVDDILARGGRADPDVPGQGIGLAVVVQLVREAHGGELKIEASPTLGGALVRAWLPALG